MTIEDKIEQLLKNQETMQNEIVALRKTVNEKALQAERKRNLQNLASVSEMVIDGYSRIAQMCTMDFMDVVYEFEVQKNGTHINDALGIKDESFTEGERASPMIPAFMASGYFKKMLQRYIYPGKVFGENKDILDICCGRGWGTRLLSEYANNVLAFDREPLVIEQSNAYWNLPNVDWTVGDALNMEFLGDRKFDLATFMEAIEHFHKKDGVQIIAETSKVLKDKAVLVGSSYFANTRHQADNHASLQKDGHLYIWTKDELREELSKYFEDIYIIDSWVFVAARGLR